MIWLTILVVFIVAVLVVCMVAQKKPDTFRFERSLRIKAPADKIFALVNDFNNWAVWSPYLKLDPAMKFQFSGAKSGVGTVHEWDGNNKAGAGRMEIIESIPSSKISMTLVFSRPMKAQNMAEFTFVQSGDETLVTWAMFGPAPLISKVMQLFIDCDKMVGKDFEEGLRNLKSATE